MEGGEAILSHFGGKKEGVLFFFALKKGERKVSHFHSEEERGLSLFLQREGGGGGAGGGGVGFWGGGGEGESTPLSLREGGETPGEGVLSRMK